MFPAAATATILDDEGNAASMQALLALSEDCAIRIASVAGLIEHRRSTERLVERQAEAKLPTRWGEFAMSIYTSVIDGSDYIALVMGDLKTCEAPLVRVHSGCVTGDILGSLKCDCGQQLAAAFEKIAEEGCGVIVYIPSHEGRGIGLVNKIRAYHLQEEGYDTVEANEALGFPPDLRDYGNGAQVLADLGITRMRLMSNNPAKYVGLQAFGLDIVERVPLETCPTAHNRRYLETKREKMGHLLAPVESEASAQTDKPTS
jgi:3,4-dihydroxy 2-butanone 4-phosphate synthase/GTP cyclohydrolase II